MKHLHLDQCAVSICMGTVLLAACGQTDSTPPRSNAETLLAIFGIHSKQHSRRKLYSAFSHNAANRSVGRQ